VADLWQEKMESDR